MIVVSVKFRGNGKTYFFDPNGLEVPCGARVVVETSKGMELADCVQENHPVDDAQLIPPLRPVLRIATEDDLRIEALCREREQEARKVAMEKIAERGLDMKLVDVECSFDGAKILFFFTSDGRVDFRELVKDLASVFRTRIELRQIGVRDEAKMLGGLGPCGRAYCCSLFMDDFKPVSTKMAKTQSLSLNPTKISGSCGRLMCCLRYEQAAYEELVKGVPKNGAFVETTAGYGNVAQVNLLRQTVKVRLDGDTSNLRSFDADEVAVVPGGRPKPGEPLPHVLDPVQKKKEVPEPSEESEWFMPPIFAEDTVSPREAKPLSGSGQDSGETKKSGGTRRRSRGGRGRGGSGGSQNGSQAKPAQSGDGSGEARHSSGQHRSRSRKKPSGGGQGQSQGQPRQPRENSGQAKPAQGGNGSGEAKRSGNSRRRGRGHRGGGGGGQDGGQAPKGE